ncbi:serine/threonine-protein phosphatase 7 long form homolog [Helianthus annuus]|uniref:serine/threonine-protein phosphatase 7 long form homolog n=1 Tax=Helianthus annuus TaxID=4232 RepID=UPI000B8EFDAE|nr:serine/threonine-protein phosphatase 7 long form homolog [Helianthus annuus]
MPFEEVTITLQDVEVLWGLKVDGHEVCGTDESYTKSEIQEKFYSLTGIFLEDKAILNNKKINMPYVLTALKSIVFFENPTDHECLQRTRTIIYLLIGSHLFPSSGSQWVDIRYIGFLEDLSICGAYSLGGAVLAYLYNQLTRATSIRTHEISGVVFLLQLWACERLPCTKPKLDRIINWNRPYGARWQEFKLSHTDTTSHVLKAYRSQFNSLSETNFIWTPYDVILSRLPEMCRSGEGC